jgi:hypothetical protein
MVVENDKKKESYGRVRERVREREFERESGFCGTKWENGNKGEKIFK